MKRFYPVFFTLIIGLPASSLASIHGWGQLAIDFTNPQDTGAKATSSEPDRIGISEGGLGWDGESNSLRDGGIETVPLALGLRSWPGRSRLHAP